jgi:protein TonB
VSAAANAAVLIAAAIATRAPSLPTPAITEAREVVYLLPMPPRRVPFEPVGVTWAGGVGPGTAAAQIDAASLIAVEAGGDAGSGQGRRGARRARGESADSVLLEAEFAGGPVYVASELDTPVTFDPTSAAPAYPPTLQAAGIEGSATMQFVVDTTGVVDSTTVKVMTATHAEFVQAVREALPNMHFRPAELGDQRVRQLVEQQFKFRIQLAAKALPNDSAPAPSDSAPVPNDSTP